MAIKFVLFIPIQHTVIKFAKTVSCIKINKFRLVFAFQVRKFSANIKLQSFNFATCFL